MSRSRATGCVSRSTFSWSLKANPQLHFTQYPKQTGHRATLGGLLAVNLAVWGGWIYAPFMGADGHAAWKATWAQQRRALEKGHIWTLFTPSLSHMDWAHMSGNMVLFLYLGKRLHELLGRARFLALYFGAAAAGTLATVWAFRTGLLGNHDSLFRYINILHGDSPDEMMSLGASDAVMGMLVFFSMMSLMTESSWHSKIFICRYKLMLMLSRLVGPDMWLSVMILM